MPVIFPPKKYDGHIFIDGGSTWNSNIVTAIDRCREIVDDDSKITIDIVICSDALLTQ